MLKPKYWHKNKSLKSVSIITKEYFDKRYGNTYFSAKVTINNKFNFNLPFQYGYSGAIDKALSVLKVAGIISDISLYDLEQKLKVSLKETIITNCLKRDVIAHGID